MISASEGIGPVNALDLALRKDLGNTKALSPASTHRLPRAILDAGTEAVTRVLIESAETKGASAWTTMSVSPNVVDLLVSGAGSTPWCQLVVKSDAPASIDGGKVHDG